MDEAIKAFDADAADDELPEASANALKSLAGLVKSLVGIEGLRQSQIRAVVKQQKAAAAGRAAHRIRHERRPGRRGNPGQQQLRELVWKQAKGRWPQAGPTNKTPTKAILAAAYRKIVGVPPPAKSAARGQDPGGQDPATPPNAKPAPKRAPAPASSFSQSQKLLKEALGST